MNDLLCACGFPLDGSLSICPKCGDSMHLARRGVHSVDVAHGGQRIDQAVRQAEAALQFTRLHGFRGLRIIHGQGQGDYRIRDAIRDAGRRWQRNGMIHAMAREPHHDGATVMWLSPPLSDRQV